MGSFISLALGFASLFVPVLFWPQNLPRLSSQLFIEKYPSKKSIRYIHAALPVVWILMYLFAFAPLVSLTGTEYVNLITFALGGGLSVGHGIIEIMSAVSMRNFSRIGPATYVVDETIRSLGWIRLGLVLCLGVALIIIPNL